MEHENIRQACIKGLHAIIKISFKVQKLKRIASEAGEVMSYY